MYPRIEGTNVCQETESDSTDSYPHSPGNSTHSYPTYTTTYQTTYTTTNTTANTTTDTTTCQHTRSKNHRRENPKTSNPWNWEKGVQIPRSPHTKRQNYPRKGQIRSKLKEDLKKSKAVNNEKGHVRNTNVSDT